MAGTKISIEVNTATVKQLVADHINKLLGEGHGVAIDRDVKIEVRSKQNYRNQEWESGEFRAVASIER